MGEGRRGDRGVIRTHSAKDGYWTGPRAWYLVPKLLPEANLQGIQALPITVVLRAILTDGRQYAGRMNEGIRAYTAINQG